MNKQFSTAVFFGLLVSVFTLGSTVSLADEKVMVERSATINASCDDVWTFAGAFGSINNLLPMIEKIESEGEKVGSIRTLYLADGAVVKERLDASDKYLQSYSFTEHPMPVSEYSATITVKDTDDGKCNFNWVGQLIPDGVSDEEAMGMFAGIYETGISELNKKFP